MTIITTLSSFIKRARPSAGVDPVRDWLIVITLSSILLVGSIVWNVWVFDTVANGGDLGATAPTVSSFDSESLTIIRTVFTNRASEEAKYATGVYRYADPSQ